MHFYHSRDFRVETAVKLLDRWGALAHFHQPKLWEIIDSVPEHLLDEVSHKQHLRVQQQKLFDLVQLCKDPEGIKEKVVSYFEIP